MKGKTNLSFWNRFSGLYDIFIKKSNKAYEQMYSFICSRLKQSMDVLELATGTGLISLAVADRVNSIEATDFSPKMIAVAKKKHIPGNVKFSVQDACNLPYPDSSFDCVIISNALHIMPDPVLALQNIRRVLKKDGMLIAPTFTHSDNGNGEKLKAKLMELFGFRTFHKWTAEQYCSFLEDNGFHVEFSRVLKSDFPLTYAEAKKIAE